MTFNYRILMAFCALVLAIAYFCSSECSAMYSSGPTIEDVKAVVADRGQIIPINESGIENTVVGWNIIFKGEYRETVTIKSRDQLKKLNRSISRFESPSGKTKLQEQGLTNIVFSPYSGAIQGNLGNSSVRGNFNDDTFEIVGRQTLKMEKWDHNKHEYLVTELHKKLSNGIAIYKMHKQKYSRGHFEDCIVYWGVYKCRANGVSVQKINELNQQLADRNITIRF